MLGVYRFRAKLGKHDEDGNGCSTHTDAWTKLQRLHILISQRCHCPALYSCGRPRVIVHYVELFHSEVGGADKEDVTRPIPSHRPRSRTAANFEAPVTKFHLSHSDLHFESKLFLRE